MSGLILFYHHLADADGFLCHSVATFRDQIRWLKERYALVGLNEMLSTPSKTKCVALTFDDGFADNLTRAAPLLEELEAPATIFACPGHFAEGPARRQEEIPPPAPPFTGAEFGPSPQYLRWSEAEQLLAQNGFNFAAHGCFHRAHFCGPRLLGFWQVDCQESRYPATGLPQMRGAPVFELSSQFAGRRFAVAEKFWNECVEVAAAGESAAALRAIYATHLEKGTLGAFESAKERCARLGEELERCRDLLRERLGIEADHLAWPWGEYDPVAVAAAQEVGFRYLYTTARGTVGSRTDPRQIPRVSAAKHPRAFRRRARRYTSPFLTWLDGLFRQVTAADTNQYP